MYITNNNTTLTLQYQLQPTSRLMFKEMVTLHPNLENTFQRKQIYGQELSKLILTLEKTQT